MISFLRQKDKMFITTKQINKTQIS